MSGKLLDFFRLGKRDSATAPRLAPKPVQDLPALARPTHCHCGEFEIVAIIRAEHFEFGDFLYAYCAGCWERMRAMHTTSKIVFNEKNARYVA